jgi:hypothetical protein
MAAIRLESYRDWEDDLPHVCMQCGAPATTIKVKQFTWHPPWIGLLVLAGLLPYVIVALVLTEKRCVAVPFCAVHRNHWAWRYAVALSGLVVLVLMFFGIVYLSSDRAFGGPDLGGWLCIGGVVCLIAWGTVVIVLHFTSIRPSEITATSITLQGVHPEFVRAFETGWAAPPALPEEAAR